MTARKLHNLMEIVMTRGPMGKLDVLENTWSLSFEIDGRSGEGGICSINIYWVSIMCQALF